MEKQFVSYELALKLKELGFDELCLARWDGGGFYMLPAYDPLKNSEIEEAWFCVLPLWQQAFDWIEKKYGLFVDRNIQFTANEVLDIQYTIKSIDGYEQIKFKEPYEEFDNYKVKVVILTALLNKIKNG